VPQLRTRNRSARLKGAWRHDIFCNRQISQFRSLGSWWICAFSTRNASALSNVSYSTLLWKPQSLFVLGWANCDILSTDSLGFSLSSKTSMPSSSLSSTISTPSRDLELRQASTQPSSPSLGGSVDEMSSKPHQDIPAQTGTLLNGGDEDDMEDMDGKTKALTNLLKTSSVSIWYLGRSQMGPL
jgi:hypothetical protein